MIPQLNVKIRCAQSITLRRFLSVRLYSNWYECLKPGSDKGATPPTVALALVPDTAAAQKGLRSLRAPLPITGRLQLVGQSPVTHGCGS